MKTTSQNHGQIAGCENRLRSRFYSKLSHLRQRAALPGAGQAQQVRRGDFGAVSGVTIWSKIDFVVDFRNLLFGGDFDLSFSEGYSLMKIFNYEADFTAKCDT